MAELKGSRTEKNLLMSFAGESQARNRYTLFAEKARKEGLEQIAAIFEETANQEKEHAKRFFSFLKGGDLEIYVNRLLQNTAAECDATPGKICFQSEGSEVEFRNVVLIPVE